MSALVVDEGGSSPSARTRPWVAIAIATLILVAVLALAALHLLVSMTNSREGRALLPSVVQPGDSVTGDLYLTDTGLLPLTYSLEPRGAAGTSPPSGLLLSVQRLEDGAYLYRGPMDTTPDLAVINPGQSTHLRVTVSAEDSTQPAAIPIPISYYWAARPVLPWWWLLGALGILAALLAFGFYRRGSAR